MKITEAIRGFASSVCRKIKLDKKQLAVLLMFAVGLGILLLTELSGDGKKDSSVTETTVIQGSSDAYISELEERVTSIISIISGAGATKVMITLESGKEDVYLHNSNYGEDADGKGGQNIEMKDEYVIVDGENGENGIVVRIREPEIRGVAVVCQGGGNARVKAEIISTVTALLDISSARVSVVQMD